MTPKQAPTIPAIVKAYLSAAPLCGIVIYLTSPTSLGSMATISTLPELILSAVILSLLWVFLPIFLISHFFRPLKLAYNRFHTAFLLVMIPILSWHFLEPAILRHYGYQWIPSLDAYASTIIPDGPGWNEIADESGIQFIRLKLYLFILISTVLLLFLIDLFRVRFGTNKDLSQ